ncbi:hypothetical protein BHM03_00061979, partial [Ensete ventricosum]
MNVVAKDMFSRFKDGKGHLKACLQHQTKGMLSLYEASYLEKEGELVLSQAMDFTTKHLKKLMEQGSLEPPLREQVASALELPLHWRMHRLHASYRIMKEKNWGDLCKTYLVEAKWYQLGHVPKLSDYLDNAWISISGHVSLTHAFCMTEDLTTKNTNQNLIFGFASYQVIRPNNVSPPPYRLCHILPLQQPQY